MKILLCIILFLSVTCLQAQKNALKTCVDESFMKMDSLNAIGKDIFQVWHDCMVGKTLPGFSVKTLDGNTIDSNTIKGKILVIDFFSIYCHSCYGNLPGLNKLIAEYKEKGVLFLALFPERLEWLQRDFFPKYKLDLPIAADAQDAIMQLGGSGYPKTYLIDRQGKIAELWPGGPMDPKAGPEIYTNAKPFIDKLLGSSTHKQ